MVNKLLSDLDFLYAIFTVSDLEIASARCAVNQDGLPIKAGEYEIIFSIPHIFRLCSRNLLYEFSNSIGTWVGRFYCPGC